MVHCTRITLVLLAALFASGLLFAQEDFQSKTLKHAKQVEEQKNHRTKQEDKLGSVLYDLLLLAEQSDTSAQKSETLHRILRNDKMRENTYQADSALRILINVKLRRLGDASVVTSAIAGLGGEVLRVGERTPYIYCRIHPKKLRGLILIDAVISVEEMAYGVQNLGRQGIIKRHRAP